LRTRRFGASTLTRRKSWLVKSPNPPFIPGWSARSMPPCAATSGGTGGDVGAEMRGGRWRAGRPPRTPRGSRYPRPSGRDLEVPHAPTFDLAISRASARAAPTGRRIGGPASTRMDEDANAMASECAGMVPRRTTGVSAPAYDERPIHSPRFLAEAQLRLASRAPNSFPDLSAPRALRTAPRPRDFTRADRTRRVRHSCIQENARRRTNPPEDLRGETTGSTRPRTKGCFTGEG